VVQQVARWQDHIGVEAATLRAPAELDRAGFFLLLILGAACNIALQFLSANKVAVACEAVAAAVLVIAIGTRSILRMGRAKRAAAAYLGIRRWRLVPLVNLDQFLKWTEQYGEKMRA
jgi:hypothetical protein